MIHEYSLKSQILFQSLLEEMAALCTCFPNPRGNHFHPFSQFLVFASVSPKSLFVLRPFFFFQSFCFGFALQTLKIWLPLLFLTPIYHTHTHNEFFLCLILWYNYVLVFILSVLSFLLFLIHNYYLWLNHE